MESDHHQLPAESQAAAEEVPLSFVHHINLAVGVAYLLLMNDTPMQVYYDPAECQYSQLLDCFFQHVDPTTKNRQGGDMGEFPLALSRHCSFVVLERHSFDQIDK